MGCTPTVDITAEDCRKMLQKMYQLSDTTMWSTIIGVVDLLRFFLCMHKYPANRKYRNDQMFVQGEIDARVVWIPG